MDNYSSISELVELQKDLKKSYDHAVNVLYDRFALAAELDRQAKKLEEIIRSMADDGK